MFEHFQACQARVDFADRIAELIETFSGGCNFPFDERNQAARLIAINLT